jgi:hypothetical protein
VPEATYNLKFQGYWRRVNVSSIPDESGIYCVYECKYNPVKKTVTLINLLYIEQSENVKTRIQNHEKLNDIEMYIKKGDSNNELCFSFASVETANRDRVEAAMIYKHKPPFNDYYTDKFDFDKTTIISTGTVALLDTDFIVSSIDKTLKELFGE